MTNALSILQEAIQLFTLIISPVQGFENTSNIFAIPVAVICGLLVIIFTVSRPFRPNEIFRSNRPRRLLYLLVVIAAFGFHLWMKNLDVPMGSIMRVIEVFAYTVSLSTVVGMVAVIGTMAQHKFQPKGRPPSPRGRRGSGSVSRRRPPPAPASSAPESGDTTRDEGHTDIDPKSG